MATATTQTRTTAVGVFANREDAQKAVAELRRLGFREADIGVAARDGETVSGATKVKDTGSNAAAGAVTGVAAGAGIGALWGMGILAGLIPGIGPAIAGGALAVLLSSAAAGAAVAGLAGALIGLGLSESEAKYYEDEFHAGRTIVTVKADGRYDEAVAVFRRFGAYDHSTRLGTATNTGADRTIELREEQLRANKTAQKVGEVEVRKEVHTDRQTFTVPVEREEVVIERRPATGHAAPGAVRAEEIRIPTKEEKVNVSKETVVKEEVNIGKRKVTDTETVSGEVKREELEVETSGDAKVRGNASRSKRRK